MSRNMAFPEGAEISELIKMLVGKAVVVKPGRELSPSERDIGAQGVYVFDDGEVAAVVLSDIAFSGSTAAALSLLNADVVQQAVRAGELNQLLRENIQEVLNISASWFNAPYRPHVRFREQAIGPAPLPEDAEGVVFDYERRLDLTVEIAGYPVGTLSLLEAA